MKRALSFILSLSLVCMTPSITALAEEANVESREVITVEVENAETVEVDEVAEVTAEQAEAVAEIAEVSEAAEVDEAVAEAIEALAAYEVNEEKIAGPLSATVLANKASATINSQVVISATVSGATDDEISYYWQKSADGVTWGGTSLNGSKTDTLSFTATEARLANYYRVVVKWGGYKAYSNAVKVELAEDPTITISANKYAAPLNTKIVITGVAENTLGAVSYKWQKSTDGTNWQSTTLTGCNSAELSFTATEARLNNYYRLVVTDENHRWYSNAVKIVLVESPVITAYTEDSELSVGDYAFIWIVPENTVGDVTIQWQKSLDGQTNWTSKGLKEQNDYVLLLEVDADNLNYYYRAKVKDDNGTWYSNTIKIDYEIPEKSIQDFYATWDSFTLSSGIWGTQDELIDFDVLEEGAINIDWSGEGVSKVEITANLMDVVPIFGIDQEEDVKSTYSNASGALGLNGYDILSDGCEYAKITVTAYDENYDLNGYTETIEFGFRFVQHYAVLVCNSDYDGDGDTDDKGDLPGVANDAEVMFNALVQLGWNVTRAENLTSTEMLEVISDGFEDAKKTDKCLFYYSGHGLGDYDWVDYFELGYGISLSEGFIPLEDALGAICGVGEDDFLFLPVLADALNEACPGKVTVLMDSCFSGAAINVASYDDYYFINTASKLQSFNDAVVKSFQNLNAKVTTKNAKTGALCDEDKFNVITAAAMNQTSLDASLTIGGENIRCGLFTYGLLAGLGVTYPYGYFEGEMLDLNGDYCYSLEEAFQAATYAAEEHHDSMVSYYEAWKDYFQDIYDNYPDNLSEEEEEDLAYFGGDLDPEGFDTFEEYWEYVLYYFVGDCQITCAYGDPNFILFSRVLMDCYSPSVYVLK